MQDVSPKRAFLPDLSSLRLSKPDHKAETGGPSLRLLALVACFAISILIWAGIALLVFAL